MNSKKVNDLRGHASGDGLLQRIAATLSRDIRATDLLARLGGDEFAMLFPDTGSATAMRLSEKVKDSIKSAHSASSIPITVSIGVATFDQPPSSFESALRVADELMYEVKQAGKNAVLHRNVAG